jgi:hypothetical protein
MLPKSISFVLAATLLFACGPEAEPGPLDMADRDATPYEPVGGSSSEAVDAGTVNPGPGSAGTAAGSSAAGTGGTTAGAGGQAGSAPVVGGTGGTAAGSSAAAGTAGSAGSTAGTGGSGGTAGNTAGAGGSGPELEPVDIEAPFCRLENGHEFGCGVIGKSPWYDARITWTFTTRIDSNTTQSYGYACSASIRPPAGIGCPPGTPCTFQRNLLTDPIIKGVCF